MKLGGKVVVTLQGRSIRCLMVVFIDSIEKNVLMTVNNIDYIVKYATENSSFSPFIATTLLLGSCIVKSVV